MIPRNQGSFWPAAVVMTFLAIESAAVKVNELCNPLEYFKPHATNATKYYECTPFPEKDKKQWDLHDVGLWRVTSCPAEEEFVELLQKCEPKRKRRRYQSIMGGNICTASNANPAVGGQCSWQSASLCPDPYGANGFLQCSPQSMGDSCGQWSQMPCPTGSQFNSQLQICVQSSVQQQCQQSGVGICGCGMEQQCPGQSVCQQSACCQQIAAPMQPPPMQFEICAGGGQPVCPCSMGCPTGTMCQSVGCCPAPQAPQITAQLCPNGQQSVCPCNLGCPQGTICQQNMCCPIPAPPPNASIALTTAPSPASPCSYGPIECIACNQGCHDAGASPTQTPQTQMTCSSGQAPLCNCEQFAQGCPTGSACQQSVGCCPTTQISITISLCPGGQQPQCPCWQGCPGGTTCVQSMCCPAPAPPPQIYNPVSLCPGGAPPVCQCSEGCPSSSVCIQSMCCPAPAMPPFQPPAISAQCPGGQQPICSCSQGCPTSATCVQSVCCPAPAMPALPPPPPPPPQIAISISICPGGQQPLCACNQGCPSGTICIQSMCCPAPAAAPQAICPTGQPAVCSCAQGCPTSTTCVQSMCCSAPPPITPVQQVPMPMCPGGQQPLCPCSQGCPPTTVCIQSVCCPAPPQIQAPMAPPTMCPSGGQPLCPCSAGCPMGAACQQAGCCPTPMAPQQQIYPQMPMCPTGQLAISICISGCPGGYSCQNGGCCPQPMPQCPTGQASMGQCGGNGGCPPGCACINGVCCPLSTCSTGQLSVQFCLQNACPQNTVCQGVGCCPIPAPTCPTGVPSLQGCQSSANCPTGYGCANGGCCMVSVQPACPPAQQPICQCAPNNMCPQGSSCTGGICCAAQQTPFYGAQLPGGACTQPYQCNGFSAGAASCQQGACSCSNQAYSTGVSCAPGAPAFGQQQSCCAQFAGGCRLRFNKAKRRPMLEPDVSNRTEPLFWRPLDQIQRRCFNNNTCTPEELCLNGRCLLKKAPGEYGCQDNMECKERCPRAYCELNTDKGIGQCLCRNAFALFGLCFSKCPEGTVQDGGRCKIVREDREFWENPERQRRLEKTHLCGKVLFAKL